MIHSPGSLRARLFWAFALVTVLAAVLPALLTRGSLYEDRLEVARQQALAQAYLGKSILESRLDAEQLERFFALAKEHTLRMTLTDPEGAVLRDSHLDADALADVDRHDDRPEIYEAMRGTHSLSVRHSNTLGFDSVYAAVRLKDGRVLRVAAPLADVKRSFETEISYMSMVIGGVACFCLLLSVLITARVRKGIDDMAEVVASIAAHKGRRRLREVPGREFLPLAYAVNHMADNVEESVLAVNYQRGQLESILDSMHEGVLVLGPSGNIRRFNRALLDLFPDLGRAEGKPLIEGLPVPDLQRRMDALLAAERAGSAADESAQEEGAVHFELPAGRFMVAHLSRPVERNDSLGAVIVVYDATELLRLERVRRDFVSNVSHELRTPLTAIIGYAEALMSGGDMTEEQRGFADIIHKHASLLAGVVNDLLALSRLENSHEPLSLVPVEAGPLLEEARESCREAARQKSLRFSVSLEGGPVLANAPLLVQVFRNLLENACRYSPHGGEIGISSRADGRMTLFTVSDQGQGIAPAELPRIFERFYQVEKQRNSGTSGIGLAICKHIIERHGGRIWAQSPHGSASTAMLFTLPSAGAGAFSS